MSKMTGTLSQAFLRLGFIWYDAKLIYLIFGLSYNKA